MKNFRPPMDVLKARDLLGIGEDMMELDEGTLRQHFAESQSKVISLKSKTSGVHRIYLKASNPTQKPKVDVRELHEAYQTMTSFIR